MALVKIRELKADSIDASGDSNLIHGDVFSTIDNEKIGSVEDILVDENDGCFRYFVVDVGTWIFGKKILLPIDYAQIDVAQNRVYARDLTKEQAENLPQFDESLRIDSDYEAQVSNIYPPRSLDTLNTSDPAAYSTTASTSSQAAPVIPPYAGHTPEVLPDPD
jgi:sporulation protein YlmC with PRC-barrel domain